LLDYLTEDAEWSEWAAAMLVKATDTGALAINQVIFGEASVRFETIEEVDRAIPADYFMRAPLPWEAAFLAAKVFAKYRRRGGTKTAPLPDFFIGAHAAVAGMTLLTRDARRYRLYFPTLRIIAP
jgi:predicted nucleic acid-binding protein